MPSPSPHMLAWSEVQQQYELTTGGQPEHWFQRGDEPPWQRWLDEHTAFAFVGQAGRLSVLKEARSRGAGYWYAYRTQARHTRKRYLGPTTKVTFARLEAAAKELTSKLSSAHPAETRREEPRPNASYQDEQWVVLLSPKLSRPRLSTPLVERERLLTELDAVRSHPLTLVSASAGSGKTTLLSTWAALSSQPQEIPTMIEGAEPVVAWLSLDSLDDDPIRFWSSVMAALRTRLPHRGQSAFAMLHSSESPPLSTILMSLLQDLMEEDSDIILILDDYHVIADQAICDSMRFLIEHVPANLHLVLVTRTDPELPLSRLRVRGRLLEIRDRDLQFTEEESANFLTQRMGLPLSEGEAATLHQRTEGWIAGLQLAALSLRKRENLSAVVKDFGGSHRFLLDYVQQEILAQLPIPLQQFLLQTSILTRMSAAACQAVIAGPDRASSQHLLEEVERANLFVVPLDEYRHWYRYHDLFREALLARLQARQPELVSLLHIRAARFYEAQGEWAEAIAHWFEARDFSAAARLMEQTAEQFWKRGEATTMARWVLALPQLLMREYAPLVLTTALYLLNAVTQTTQEQRARVHTEVRQLMTRVETALRRAIDETDREISTTEAGAGAVSLPEDLEDHTAEEALLHRRLHLLHMQMVLAEAIASGEFGRLSAIQQEIEEALDRDEEAIWQMVPLSCSFILHFTVWQAGARLLPRLLSAKEQVRRKASHFASIKVRQYLVVAAMEAGHLRLAYEESLTALELIEQIVGYALLKGYFEIVLAQVWYQWGHLEEAHSLLHTIVQDAAAWQHLDLLGWGYAELMQVALVRGEWSLAQQALHEVEQLVQRERYGTYPGWLPALRAQWWLAQGRLREVSDWAAGVVFPQGAWDSGSYSAFPLVIQVYFAQQRWREALELLERWRGHLDRPANIRITITFLTQYLVALHQVGQTEQARGVAARLFALTEPEGNIRVYLDAGEPLKQALKTLLLAPPGEDPAVPAVSLSKTYVSSLLAAFEQEERRSAHRVGIPLADHPEIQPELTPTEGQENGPGTLSRQELQVLRLLVTGQTYLEMAQTLVVSPNTIKTHVSSIYRKLGVSRRAEAIELTRRLHLL